MVPLEKKTPGLRTEQHFLVDTNTRRLWLGVIAGGAGLIVLLSLGVWWTVRAVLRMLWPERHPLARALRRFGTPGEVAALIEKDSYLRARLRVGPVHFLGGWMVCSSGLIGYKVFRLDDLVWVYQIVVTGSGRHHLARFHDRHGAWAQVNGREPEINAILTAIARPRPWLLAGYALDLEQMWHNDRAALVEIVDQRKKQPPEELLSSQPEQTPDQS